ncbi:MAG: ORF6N domain-containing protein [bacterium]
MTWLGSVLNIRRMLSPNPPVPLRRIEQAILVVRGHRVMLSADLAALYGVEPKVLIQTVKRNIERFPDDFMFQLTRDEHRNLKSQIVTSSWGGARRALPYAFTEQGVAMLSSVLRSKRAVQVNVEIVRAFVRLRRILAETAGLTQRLDELEKGYDIQFKVVFDAIRQLMQPPPAPKRRKIGFATGPDDNITAHDRPPRPHRVRNS